MLKDSIHFFLKIFTYISLLVFLNFQISYAQPLSAKFYTNTLEAKVGDTILLRLKINPRYDRPIYTVSASLMYDPSTLEYIDAGFADSIKILPVPKEPFYLTDTEKGMIRRTAGFPNGADSLSDFTTYKFMATKVGDTKISIEDGVALDVDNIDIGLQQKEITIHIAEAKDEIPVPKMLDLNLNLDILGPIAIYKEESYSFPIDRDIDSLLDDVTIKFFVYNEKAELYYLDEKTFRKAENEPLSFTIPENTLDIGNYVLSAETVGEDGNREIIAQKTIGVLSNGENWYDAYKVYLIPIFIILTFLAIIHHLMRDREIYDKLQTILGKKGKKGNVKKPLKNKGKIVDNF